MTPEKIQELAEPAELLYVQCTNALLLNICRHISSPTWTHTAAWEIQKLSELGQLTRENAEIINRYAAKIAPAVRESMTESRRLALEGIERDLQRGVEAGTLPPPMRDSTADVLRDMLAQAEDRLNLTNTQMLQSSVDEYARAIRDAGRYMAAHEMPQAALDILNRAAAQAALQTETLRNAQRRAILDLNDEGLTGFVDRAGRHWTPEAYVNMVVRTTVHNTAIESVKGRMADYGADVFQISAHSGARPLCEPYQGYFYSWDGSEGEMLDGNGQTIQYESIEATSYGLPAGIFGINCGHMPIPMVPEISIPHAQEFVQTAEENAKAYAESQEQRALERDIRAAKRGVMMLGDKATQEDKDKVKQAQAAMREFIERTGRGRRYDREQVLAP